MQDNPHKAYSFDQIAVLGLRSYELPQSNCFVDIHVCVTKKDGIFKMRVPAGVVEYVDKSFHEQKWDDGSVILTCSNLAQLDTVIKRAFRLYKENHQCPT